MKTLEPLKSPILPSQITILDRLSKLSLAELHDQVPALLGVIDQMQAALAIALDQADRWSDLARTGEWRTSPNRWSLNSEYELAKHSRSELRTAMLPANSTPDPLRTARQIVDLSMDNLLQSAKERVRDHLKDRNWIKMRRTELAAILDRLRTHEPDRLFEIAKLQAEASEIERVLRETP